MVPLGPATAETLHDLSAGSGNAGRAAIRAGPGPRPAHRLSSTDDDGGGGGRLDEGIDDLDSQRRVGRGHARSA